MQAEDKGYLNEQICATCGKTFYPQFQNLWTYRDKKKGLWWCSYGCMRKKRKKQKTKPPKSSKAVVEINSKTGKVIKEWASVRECADEYICEDSRIRDSIRQGVKWFGHIFKYKEEL